MLMRQYPLPLSQFTDLYNVVVPLDHAVLMEQSMKCFISTDP